MSEPLPKYVTDEIATTMQMSNAVLLKSYQLYLQSDWHQYSEIVIEEMKKELINRGITI